MDVMAREESVYIIARIIIILVSLYFGMKFIKYYKENKKKTKVE